MNKTLLSYSLLLLLILAGWLAVSLVPEQNNNNEEAEAEPQPRSDFQLGKLVYYEKGAPVYRLSYESSSYVDHWTLASPSLVLSNEQGEDMILSAETANVSASNEFSFSGQVMLRDRSLNRELRAAKARLNSEAISFQGAAQFNAEKMRLDGDQIQLSRDERSKVQARGSPLRFAYQSINGEAETMVYDEPNLLLSGEVSGQDDERSFAANQVHMTENTIELSTNAYWQQDDLWLRADTINLMEDLTGDLTGEQQLEAKGSPLQFRYQSLDGEAETMVYDQPNLLLSGEVSGQDDERSFAANQVRITENTIELSTNAHWQQDELWLRADSIDLMEDSTGEQQLEAKGSPLQFRYQSLNGEAETMVYDEPNLRLSGEVSGQDDERSFAANQVHMTENTIELSTNAYWQQDELWLKADSIHLMEALTGGQQQLEAKGSPLQFRYQSLDGEAETMVYDEPNLLLSGEVSGQDDERSFAANQVHMTENTIELSTNAHWQQDELWLKADSINLMEDLTGGQQQLEAKGSPLQFRYQSLDGEAETMVYDEPNLLLSGEVSGQDDERSFAANQVRMTENTIELSTNAYWQQDDLWLKADFIDLMEDLMGDSIGEQQLEANGSPLQFRYQSLDGEAKSLSYTDERLELEQQVVLNDQESDRHLKAERVILTEESIEAQGNAELEQSNLTILADHIDYRGSAAVIRGNPLNFEYGDGLFYGEGELLEIQPGDDQFLLQGTPAKIERSGIDKQQNFSAKAEQIELAQNKLILQRNIHIQTEDQELRAAYAVYRLDTKDWLVDGKSIDNRPPEQIELIIPR